MANKIKLSPSRQMTRVSLSLRGRKIRHFDILFQNAEWKGIPNCGVNLHFQHWNLMVNSSLDLNCSLDFSNVTNHRRCCVNLQAIWNIISTWPNNRSRGLKLLSILPKCRPLLAVKLYLFGCTSHLTQKHYKGSRAILLINFPAMML